MRTIAASAVLIGLLAAAERPAQAQFSSSAKAFRYKGGKVDAGVVYAYDRSDFGGTKTGSVLVYMPDRKHVEILRVVPGREAGQLVTGEMDWETCSLGRFEVWKESPDGARTRQAVATAAGDALAVTVEDPALYGGKPGAATFSVSAGHVPEHVAAFDLVTLALALRHLADPQGSVEVALVKGNGAVSEASPAWLVPAGKVTVSYAEDVNRDGVDCAKYTVTGPALGSGEGALWYQKEKGYLQEMEVPIAGDTDWPEIRLAYRGSEKASEKEWASRRSVEIRKGAKR